MDVARDFHHPLEPYPIQLDFMNAVYDCLENRKIGILESPTGIESMTKAVLLLIKSLYLQGKSLSLICGSLTWLRDHKRRVFEQDLDVEHSDTKEPDWLLDHVKQQKKRDVLNQKREINARLAKIRAKEDRARARFESGEPPTKKQKTLGISTIFLNSDEEATFLLEDYESEQEHEHDAHRSSSSLGLSAQTLSLLEKAGTNQKSKDDSAEVIEDELKIFFCSRTHSQLSQFVNELRRVHMPSSLDEIELEPLADEGQDESANVESIKQLTLGSRKALCINPKVSRLSSVTAINERCLELQQPKTPKEAKCPHMTTRENEVLVHDFRDHTLAKIRDIEDLGSLGKKIGICPYYASRAAIRPSEMVTLPYPLLLQKSAREALGLSLKDHVVIIDEAHNLVDAISNIHSVSVSLDELSRSRAQLGIYLQKFRNRLKGKNRVYVTQLVRLIDSLSGSLQAKYKSSNHPETQVDISQLLDGKGVDQINLHKLMRYLQESKLAHKVDGYQAYVNEQDVRLAPKAPNKPVNQSSGTMPVLTTVATFMLALANPAAEGRFFCIKGSAQDGRAQEITLKYLLLDPTQHFKEIVEEARAVILAGGTLSPIDNYRQSIVPDVPLSRTLHLSCSHVIPSTNLLAASIETGPKDVQLDFTFDNRNSSRMVHEIGSALIDLASIVPDGMVVFFPSYGYLSTFLQQLQTISSSSTSAQRGSMWDRLSSIKGIFLEPGVTLPDSYKTEAASGQPKQSAETVLAAYASHIANNSPNGAILFAVISGSLSEGINFSDALGRLIAVVGLPFPNSSSATWQAKMDFVKQRALRDASTLSASSSAPTTESANTRAAQAAAQQHTMATTMRAVNQSIGRAIRHKDDWAAILLLDRRYGRSDVLEQLPPWIARSMMPNSGSVAGSKIAGGGRKWGEVMSGLKGFYQGRRT